MSSASDSGFWSKAHNKHKTRKRVVAAFGKRLPKTTILLPGVDIMCLKSISYWWSAIQSAWKRLMQKC
jgi:hypothetical protein